MIRADVGSMPKVNGSSMATVFRGDIPGSTPTKVPTSAPKKQYSRLMGEKATENPRDRFWRKSMLFLPPRYRNVGQIDIGSFSPTTKASVVNTASAMG